MNESATSAAPSAPAAPAMIEVPLDDLYQVLRAFYGQPYEVLDLWTTRDLPGPVDNLRKALNEYIKQHEADRRQGE